MRKTLLAAALLAGFAGSALAANPQPAGFSLKLDAAHAAGPGVGVVNTDLPDSTTDGASAPLGVSTIGAAVNVPVPVVAPSVLPQVAAGVPMIPGSLATSAPVAATVAATAAPAQVASQPVASSAVSAEAIAPAAASGIAPGVPVKVYATLTDAAKAGIDPLGERKVAPAPVEQSTVSRGFDWKNPKAYVTLAKRHQSEVIQGGLGLLVALLVLALIRRRRG
ncbi:hypothetical protein [Burkholderia cenocepacia]|uniref:hypothetical protein n=1 Tax=Burkholderia cenocepacia TaxID=95486 RepID=UPI00076BCC48|nr:hypothetical protein [Burkholderia cenocepacia]KWU24766.1 hypothetical protein AS149_31980 [Burkholderia cenocepacia]